MAEQFLNGLDMSPVLEQVLCESIPQCMRRHMDRDPRLSRLFELPGSDFFIGLRWQSNWSPSASFKQASQDSRGRMEEGAPYRCSDWRCPTGLRHTQGQPYRSSRYCIQWK